MNSGRKTARRRGIALVAVMMAILFCLMLLGAFLQSNRNYTQLFQRGQSQDMVDDSTRSLYEFARSSLEKDKAWGRPLSATTAEASLGSDPANPDIVWQGHAEESPSDREGEFTGKLANGMLFRLDILNNFRTVSSFDGVQAKSCRISVKIYLGLEPGRSHRDILEHPDSFVYLGGATVLVRNAAYFDSGVLASTGIELHAMRMNFLSKDPIRNQVRSNAHIKLPEIHPGNLDFAFLRDVGGGVWAPYEPRGFDGTMWAKSDILLGTDSSTDQSRLAQASRDTNGQFIPNARTNYNIPKLDPEDIAVASRRRNLRSGTYLFTNFWVQHGGSSGPRVQIPILLRYSTIDDGPDPGDVPDLRLEEYYYVKGSLPGANHDDTCLLGGNEQYGAPMSLPFSAREPDGGDNKFMLPDADDTGATGLRVDLIARDMSVEPGLTLDVDGDFLVASIENSDVALGDLPEYEAPVTLRLGSATERSSIRSEGSISIEGTVKGKGSLVAGTNVSLHPNAVSLASDVESDLALYAQENVLIRTTDNSGGTTDVSFKGLVYAEKNFFMLSNSNLEIEGALVARTGHVFLVAGTADSAPPPVYFTAFHPEKNLKITYNPDYLDSLLDPSTQERTKVELLAWRPNN